MIFQTRKIMLAASLAFAALPATGAEEQVMAHTDAPIAPTSVEKAPETHPAAEPVANNVPTDATQTGSGIVFGVQPSSTSSADSYQPDWSRFDKAGLFGSQPATDAVTSDESVDIQAAESHYLELLNMNLPDEQRMKTLMELAQLYHKYNVRPKEAAVYERFIEVYPQDPIVPEIYMRLGFLYRDIGAFKTSLARFYSVLNASLSVNRIDMEAYKLLSLRAQIEIADTYYAMGDYEHAAKFYLRLKRLDMGPEDRIRVDFKYAYTQYLRKDYPTTISSLQAFIRAHPKDSLVAEAHFVLASAYKQINQPRAALNEVLNLLQYQEDHKDDSGMWTYWKKRTGNQLGNEFYEQGDFESALRIYQAMAPLNKDPNWLWPVLYQMGLCFERLHLITKAVDAYAIIIKSADQFASDGVTLPEPLQDILEQAKWRTQHLDWENQTDREVQQILGK